MKPLQLRGKGKELPLSYHCLGGYREKKDQEEKRCLGQGVRNDKKPSRAKKTAARSIASSQKGKNYQLGLVTTKVMGQGKTKPQRNAMRTDCPMREKDRTKG